MADLDTRRRVLRAHTKSRRIFLRDAMGVCCAISAPVLLSACGDDDWDNTDRRVDPDLRDDVPPADPTGAGGPETAGDAAADPAANKLSKAASAYQDHPRGEQKCANCQLFEPESRTCKVVEGDIAPEAWCSLWVAIA